VTREYLPFRRSSDTSFRPGPARWLKVKLPMALVPDPVIRSPSTVALESISIDSVPMVNTMTKLRELPDTTPPSMTGLTGLGAAHGAREGGTLLPQGSW
jgi:hypothetical protein